MRGRAGRSASERREGHKHPHDASVDVGNGLQPNDKPRPIPNNEFMRYSHRMFYANATDWLNRNIGPRAVWSIRTSTVRAIRSWRRERRRGVPNDLVQETSRRVRTELTKRLGVSLRKFDSGERKAVLEAATATLTAAVLRDLNKKVPKRVTRLPARRTAGGPSLSAAGSQSTVPGHLAELNWSDLAKR